MKASLRVLAALLALAAGPTLATSVTSAPKTLRVDIQHSGDASREAFALDRVIVEPVRWPGNMARTADNTNRGANRFDVVDAASGKLLYSRGYSTIFGEWRTTDEASNLVRSFQESLRFPMPSGPVELHAIPGLPRTRCPQPRHAGVELVAVAVAVGRQRLTDFEARRIAGFVVTVIERVLGVGDAVAVGVAVGVQRIGIGVARVLRQRRSGEGACEQQCGRGDESRMLHGDVLINAGKVPTSIVRA